ncbi:hypothetical protein [Nesterenkonia pannonica]|nr:hypothetical protein [Nesterenkonia pannonica]
MGAVRLSRWLPVIAVGLYVLIPVLCAAYYAVFPGAPSHCAPTR